MRISKERNEKQRRKEEVNNEGQIQGYIYLLIKRKETWETTQDKLQAKITVTQKYEEDLWYELTACIICRLVCFSLSIAAS